MKCPICGDKTGTKSGADGKGYRRRRRECNTCGQRFSTREIAVEDLEAFAQRLLRNELDEKDREIRELRRFKEAVQDLVA